MDQQERFRLPPAGTPTTPDVDDLAEHPEHRGAGEHRCQLLIVAGSRRSTVTGVLYAEMECADCGRIWWRAVSWPEDDSES